jgi:glycosyltransferase involved in cell wall biosynthesis
MRERIRVALVVNSTLRAGAETAVFDIASRLNTSQFDATVYSLTDYGPARATLDDAYVKAAVRLVFLAPGQKTRQAHAIGNLITLFRRDRPHVVHLHLPDAVIAGGIAAFFCGLPFIIHEHQTHNFHSWKVRLAYRVLRIFASLTLTFSERVEEELFGNSEVLVHSPERLSRPSFTIKNAVPVDTIRSLSVTLNRDSIREELGAKKGSIVIGSVARFVSWKGHRNLIEAFAIVSASIPSAVLCIIGDGPLYKELRALVHDRGLEEKIIMPGSRTDVHRLLVGFDIFSLVFSYPKEIDTETVGIAGWEAMAAALPVLAAKYSNIDSSLRDGENVVLVPPEDPLALAEAIKMLVLDEQKRRHIGKAGYELVSRNMNWNAIMPIYERIYRLVSRL